MKIHLYLFLLLTFVSGNILAQSNLLNARVPQDVGELNEAQTKANNAEHLKYGYVDDRDIIWSKTVWEVIDLDERINFPLYFPTERMNLGDERKALFDVLKENIENGNIKEVYVDPYFKNKLSLDQLSNKFIARDTLPIAYDEFNATGQWNPLYISANTAKALYVRQYRIKGTWYFDKRLGELKYRLLAIAPVVVNFKASISSKWLKDPNCCPEDEFELFWVWFPDAREWLNKEKVFNSRNSSQPITYDHLLNSRRFNSTIYKEENLYEDREINQYISNDALRMLLESERIKSIIRDFEQDMWNN